MRCFNFLVGQFVFKNMFEMVMLATKSSKMHASVALSSFFLEGGLRWKALKDGVRVPYHSPCGIVKGINLIPGGSFDAEQLQLMRDATFFNLMLAAKTGNRGALLRLDTVVFFGDPIGEGVQNPIMDPHVCSTLIAVRLWHPREDEQHTDRQDLRASEYLISIEGAQGISAFDHPEAFETLMRDVDYA